MGRPVPEPLPLEDGILLWAPDWLDATESAQLFHRLQQTLAWRRDRIRMFGREVAIPRLQAWYGDPGCRYRYSGLTLDPLPWTPELAKLRAELGQVCGCAFNSVLANLYPDGAACVGWHADNEPELGPEPVIASLTLGATRRFSLRHRTSGRRLDLELPSGALLIMAGSLQHHWLHALPRTRRPTEARINLSFRRVMPA